MKKKAPWKLTAKALSIIAKPFDEEFAFEKTRRLTPSERMQWQRVRRKRKSKKAP